MIRDVVIWSIVASAIAVLLIYVVINAFYLAVHVAGLLELHEQRREQRYDPAYGSFDSRFLPGVALIVPAYNEESTIVDSVRSMLEIDYPEVSVIAVNDGSSDATLDRLDEVFDLELVSQRPPWELCEASVRGIYRSGVSERLYVIDKENGGKSDALNAGINFTEQPLFCSIDADSIIDRQGLRRVVAPFVANPREVIAAGGTVRIANGCTIEDGHLLETRLPESHLVQMQEVEYLRSFYSGRLGLSRLRNLLVISGTFGMFRTDVVREVGGYRLDTVTEDLDLVVRLHRRFHELDRPYRVEFVSEPIVWTQAPDRLSDLSRQRRRWYRGLLEVIVANRDMVANPRYGRIGLVGLPLHILAEVFGPLLETFGYLVVITALLLGVLHVEFFVLFLLVIIGIGIFLSTFGIFSEVWSYRRYNDPGEIATLLGAAIVENLGYRQWRAFVAVHGLIEFLRRDTHWGVIRRRRFGVDRTDAQVD
ncbi:MAG: glycosyltransferase family 2 protein [Halobacteriota archaeon]